MNERMIVVEGARADHMPGDGDERQTMPFLDAVARQGACGSLGEPWRGNVIDTETGHADARRRARFTWLSDTEQRRRCHRFDALVYRAPAAPRCAAVE